MLFSILQKMIVEAISILQKMIVEAIRPLPFQSSKFLVVRNGETTTSRLDGTSYPILKNPKLPNPKLLDRP